MKGKIIYIIHSIAVIFFPCSLMAQSAVDINYLKAKAKIDASEPDSAIFYLDKAAISSKNAEVFLEKGKILYSKAQYEAAIQEFIKVEETEKGKAAIWLARSYSCLNDIDNCLTYLQIHLNSRFRLPESTILLDKDFQILENDLKWKKFWREGNWYSAFDKTMAEADFLIKTRKFPDAINLLTESLSKGYRKSPIYERRASIYYELKNYNLALSDLNNAISAGGDNPHLFHQRAKINYLLNNYRKSLEDYNTALKYNPSEMDLYQGRALAYNKNGMYQSAMQDMNFYLSLYPKNDSAWFNFGIIHYDNKNFIEALSCFNKSLALNTSDPRYYNARGLAYLNTRSYIFAWKDFAMALDLDPRNSETYINKGIASINLGDSEDACFCFETAKRLGNNKAISYIEKYCK